jgi:hypothetical protein
VIKQPSGIWYVRNAADKPEPNSLLTYKTIDEEDHFPLIVNATYGFGWSYGFDVGEDSLLSFQGGPIAQPVKEFQLVLMSDDDPAYDKYYTFELAPSIPRHRRIPEAKYVSLFAKPCSVTNRAFDANSKYRVTP